MSSRFLTSAILGAFVWPIAFALLPASAHKTIIGVLLLGPLVVVPLGLARIVSTSRILPQMQLLAATLFATSFIIPGELAAWLILPWLAFTLAVAVLRFDRSAVRVPDLCRLAAVLYLPIGVAWALCYRLGYSPLGFPDVIVLLTGAHFHFAGFALPILAGEVAQRSPTRLTRLAAVVAIGTVPVVASGITVTHLGGPKEFELIAAWVLSIAGLALGICQLRLAGSAGPSAGTCLAVSALSLMFAVVWSTIYAGGQYGLWDKIDVPFMAHWHGIVNAFGFALVGLIGWTLRKDDP